MSRARFACIAMAVLAFAPDASAQKPKVAPPKKEEPKKEEPKTEEPKKEEPKAEEPKKEEPAATAAASNVEPPADTWDSKDVTEVPGKTYLFIGLRYRGNIVPQFMLNMFVDYGATIYSNTIGIELDMRKDNFSLIPALQYTEYGTGDIIFKEKNADDRVIGNYSLVNSSMKGLYATADLLWSTPISKNVQFEYGAGLGLGIIFGDLETTWVREDPNGELFAGGRRLTRCASEGEGGPKSGCNKADHQNASVAKTGKYIEPSWFGGGSIPVVFPYISVPQIGLRFKPVKQFAGRLGLGFSLTGFWFGLSGAYGLEQKPKP